MTRLSALVATLSLVQGSLAAVAPDITWIQEGFNCIAKLPCVGCPFLVQDTSKGEVEPPWTERKDNNALLLNISLPYDSAFLSINNQPIYSNPTYKLPIIYANQVLSDISTEDLNNLIATNQLEASHESNFGGGGYFGLSYRASVRHISKSAAVLYQFDVEELSNGLTEKDTQFKLSDRNQKMLEIILLQRPVYAATEPPTFEIIKAALVPRSNNPVASKDLQKTMVFKDWDSFGKKGTTAHLLTSWGDSFMHWMDSGVWALFIFVFAVVGLFCVVCLLCVFGCDLWATDDYEQAQHGKARDERRRGKHGDVESGRPQFKSAEELGLMGRSKVVGVGKRD
ncbi:hypothetical protein BU24DRAFT_226875 [Aaosphaeria arxii CBS 175.79]|uniref:Uncharacterized protein n=1 Tax=Aaosphaeria arxii CBS 175.79 TaxID=1450172 RepID=A0A6A5XPF3_9PLEO|nr:uncharacterized protein BU24DRAFT_226875 [Aaosphaeria arxii CBS 175.79]KAF2015022.1 hypothetical protein BU24DRAFT_226875 [Aaosphaeria arxii CBS 175.79]